MAKGFFVTGTDTGVGKTVITAALVKAVRLLGFRACAMKPIETGCRTADGGQQTEAGIGKKKSLIPTDGTFLLNNAGSAEYLDLVNPVRFEKPLAPMAASEIEGVAVDLKKIRKAYLALAGKYDALVIEGIGGLLVPVMKDYYVIDLAGKFGLPLIVVARPGLGTINHTLLTVNYAVKEGLNVAGIIVNYSRPPDGGPAEATNTDIIKRLSLIPIIGVFPYLEDLSSNTIEKAAEKNLDFGILKKYL
jgi:dethiobiotin synthetase